MTNLTFASRGRIMQHQAFSTMTAAEAAQWARRNFREGDKRGVLFIHWPATGKYRVVKLKNTPK